MKKVTEILQEDDHTRASNRRDVGLKEKLKEQSYECKDEKVNKKAFKNMGGQGSKKGELRDINAELMKEGRKAVELNHDGDVKDTIAIINDTISEHKLKEPELGQGEEQEIPPLKYTEPVQQQQQPTTSQMGESVTLSSPSKQQGGSQFTEQPVRESRSDSKKLNHEGLDVPKDTIELIKEGKGNALGGRSADEINKSPSLFEDSKIPVPNQIGNVQSKDSGLDRIKEEENWGGKENRDKLYETPISNNFEKSSGLFRNENNDLTKNSLETPTKSPVQENKDIIGKDTSLGETITNKAQDIKESTGSTLNQARDTVGETLGNIQDNVTQKAGEAKDFIAEKGTDVKNYVQDKTEKAGDYLQEKKEALGTGINNLKDKVVNAFQDAKDKILEKAGDTKDYLIEKTNTSDIGDDRQLRRQDEVILDDKNNNTLKK